MECFLNIAVMMVRMFNIRHQRYYPKTQNSVVGLPMLKTTLPKAGLEGLMKGFVKKANCIDKPRFDFGSNLNYP